MIIRLLQKIHSKNSSLRIALASQRKKYRPDDSAFWGQVFSNIYEIEKNYITINYIEHFLLQKNLSSVKDYLDLITYWHYWNKKSSERITFESKKFFFASNKEKRLVSTYLDLITQNSIPEILESVSDPAEKWSIKFSLPILLYNSLSQDFSFKDLNLLGNWFNTPSPKYIWINNQDEEYSSFITQLKTKISLLEINAVKKSFIVQSKQPIQSLDEFKKGKILIQDLGATIVSQLVPKVTGTIIDLCASPGNKTVQLFDTYAPQDMCTIFAGDVPGSRYRTLLQRIPHLIEAKPSEITSSHSDELEIEKQHKKLIIKPWDGTQLSFEDEFADLIFIDAPCTGSGTMGSKPDSRGQLDEQFLHKHVEVQKKLLKEADRVLKKQGYLFYSTCSLLTEENEDQINSFLEQYPNYTIISLQHHLNSPKLLISGSIKLFPPLSNTDGFFAILLQKTSNKNQEGNN